MSPGVDFALVTKRTLSTGKSDGIKTAVGITSGVLVHTAAAAFGLSILLMQSALAFEIVKYLGAFYLIYLGVSSFLQKNHLDQTKQEKVPSVSHSAFKQGFISNTLNPKVAIFFLTFLPQFIDPHFNASLQFMILGIGYALLSIVWFITMVFFLEYIRKWMTSPTSQKMIERITGFVLIGFGTKLLFTSSK